MLNINSIIDILLILYLLKKQTPLTAKQLIKLIFLSELAMEKNQLFGFDFQFIRYHYGPFSFNIEGIQKFMDDLRLADSLCMNIGVFQFHKTFLSRYGRQFLNEFTDLFEENEEIAAKIDTVIDTFKNYTGKALENYCYTLEVDNVPISEIPFYEIILDPEKDADSKHKFTIEEDWIETFHLLLDEQRFKQLKRIIEINRSAPAIKYTP